MSILHSIGLGTVCYVGEQRHTGIASMTLFCCFDVLQQGEERDVMLPDTRQRAALPGHREWQRAPAYVARPDAERARHLPGRHHAEVSHVMRAWRNEAHCVMPVIHNSLIFLHFSIPSL